MKFCESFALKNRDSTSLQLNTTIDMTDGHASSPVKKSVIVDLTNAPTPPPKVSRPIKCTEASIQSWKHAFFDSNLRIFPHLPWGDNSCAFDASMVAMAALYHGLRDDESRDKDFSFLVLELPTVCAIFKRFFEGSISNVDMKVELFALFEGIVDDAWSDRKFLCTKIPMTFLKDELLQRAQETSLFSWKIESSVVCEGVDCRSGRIVINSFQVDDFFLGQAQADTSDLGAALLAYCDYSCNRLWESNRTALSCSCGRSKSRNDVTHSVSSSPLVLHVGFDRKLALNFLWPLPPKVEFGSAEYKLYAVVYGNDEHFKTRYIIDNEVREADGMINPDQSVVVSNELPWHLPSFKYRACDLYYLKN